MYVMIKAILWASGNYCGLMDLIIPLPHRLLALNLGAHPECVVDLGSEFPIQLVMVSTVIGLV